MGYNELLARKDKTGAVQTLRDHLHGAGRLAESFEDEFSATAKTAALLHDLGKATEKFQRYLLSDDGRRGDVIHAWQGAFVVNDFETEPGSQKIAQELLEMVISRHHGGLPDCIAMNGDEGFFDRLTDETESDEKYSYQEVLNNLSELNLDTSNMFSESVKDVTGLFRAMKDSGVSTCDSMCFFLGLYVKYIFSRLVDADRLDAACFESKRTYVPNEADWEALLERFQKNLSAFDSSSEIGAVRKRVSDLCREASGRRTGIYKLSVPTGGGKTLSSLNFALHHALKTGKRRIIYVIPFLSITAQTSKVFRDILDLDDDGDVLLEHYSSVGMDDESAVGRKLSEVERESEDEGERQRKLAAERWDSPIIVTTMVQFLETVMSAKGTKLRKFHNMTDSVIIFDEIQSLPTNTINLFNEVVSFLSSMLGCTILLCSATQPLLERTERKNLLLSDHPELIEVPEGDVAKLKRTNIVASVEQKTCDELASIVLERARENGNCLAIVNLKSEAENICRALRELDDRHEFEIVHLSTSMCGKHRMDKLNHVRALLDGESRSRVICVSTQLIEAGVDISFSCVVRAMAGLDSILQAAGRCNRNGESSEAKSVYVYPVKDETGLNNLKDIQTGKELTDQLVREYPNEDLLSKGMLEEYYGRFLARLQERPDAMDYALPGGESKTAYGLLSFNTRGRGEYRNRHDGGEYPYAFAQGFKTVNDGFHVIPNLTKDIVVRYGRASELLDRLADLDDLREKVRVLRLLQQYSVSLFDRDFDLLYQKRAFILVNKEFNIYALDSSYYDDVYGVLRESEMPVMMI
ncbi:CRISPR-associated helicase Cas3' [Bifidobacterium eulemuris]|uniref:CRISPR-associated helicase Cas3' n=1 Tax=Bifidobacterium eulemuris TaxID=1765219 RepID=UPI00299F8FC1|nr:CRISPR-associated helicase Cas3' [Bifidobacterium eulemuris]